MSMHQGEKRLIKFTRNNCTKQTAHVKLYKYEDGSLELWHYSSNVLNIDSEGVLRLGHNYNYGPLTASVCHNFCAQQGVTDQYNELLLNVKTVDKPPRVRPIK